MHLSREVHIASVARMQSASPRVNAELKRVCSPGVNPEEPVSSGNGWFAKKRQFNLVNYELLSPQSLNHVIGKAITFASKRIQHHSLSLTAWKSDNAR